MQTGFFVFGNQSSTIHPIPNVKIINLISLGCNLPAGSVRHLPNKDLYFVTDNYAELNNAKNEDIVRLREKRGPNARGLFSYGFGRFGGYRSTYRNTAWRRNLRGRGGHSGSEDQVKVTPVTSPRSVTKATSVKPRTGFATWWTHEDNPNRE